MATSMITSLTLSAPSGFKNGGGINSSKLGVIYSNSKTALKTAVSQAKRNIYLSNITGVGDVMAREIGGMVRDSAISVGVAWVQSGFGAWFGK